MHGTWYIVHAWYMVQYTVHAWYMVQYIVLAWCMVHAWLQYCHIKKVLSKQHTAAVPLADNISSVSVFLLEVIFCLFICILNFFWKYIVLFYLLWKAVFFPVFIVPGPCWHKETLCFLWLMAWISKKASFRKDIYGSSLVRWIPVVVGEAVVPPVESRKAPHLRIAILISCYICWGHQCMDALEFFCVLGIRMLFVISFFCLPFELCAEKISDIEGWPSAIMDFDRIKSLTCVLVLIFCLCLVRWLILDWG